jgi:hypothetical protein
MKTKSYIIVLIATLALFACNHSKYKKSKMKKPDTNAWVKGDSSVYGLACDGCTDSVLILLPADCSDPVKYDIINATHTKNILGAPHIGDAIEVVLNKNDKKVADKIININELMGTWCYIVMPKMRDFSNLSKKSQNRMINNMPDSIKQTYFIPREYGFSLKQQYTAGSIGYIHKSNSLEEESPVVYKPMSLYTKWHLWNGKILLVRVEDENKNKHIEYIDTCNIDYLKNDSLVLSSDGVSRGYYRRANAKDANKKARIIAAQQAKKALKEALSN